MNRDHERDFDLLYRGSLGCIVLAIIFKLLLVAGVVWVAWHFIAKYW